MANISFKNKKFPIKAVPTVGIALIVAFAIVFLSEFFLRDSVRQLNLSDFELKKCFWGQKSDLCEFDQNGLHLAIVSPLFGAKFKMIIFIM